MRISATVITLNEERWLAAALDSLAWADEIVVVDSGSTDRTLEIARARATRVVEAAWPGYAAQKNRAADEASNDWIFSLDADEVVTPELAASIAKLRAGEPAANGFRVARRAWYVDRWVRHGGWYPDWQVRLYDRRAAKFEGEFVHESVRVARPGTLDGDLLHYTIENLGDHHRRIDRYTTLAAEALARAGRAPSLARAFFGPVAAFARAYVLKRGFRDGAAGLAIAGFAAYYVFLRQMKLWEMTRERRSGGKS